MKLAVDTSAYLEFVRGDKAIQMLLEAAEVVYLPVITLAEIRCGLLYGKHSRTEETVLNRFLSRPGTSVLYPDVLTPRHYAALWLHLKQAGTPIPQNDLWIASLVVQHGLTLLTRDEHFAALPQVVRV